MVIGFNKQFVQPILEGTKIHTIRLDKGSRWKPNIIMHMATGVRTKQYNCFKKEVCKHVEHISIEPDLKLIRIGLNGNPIVIIRDKGVEILVKNDGFKSVEEFWQWFNVPFIGKLISWTDYRY